MYSLQQFSPHVPDNKVETLDAISKDMDIFFRDESEFLPLGKTWNDLSPEEKKLAKERYRFDPMRPGIYQTMTGNQNMA
jgi:hypothetical protein